MRFGEGHWLNGFRLAMTIAGTTIGAGFASGREIWEFFAVHGTGSLQGIAVFSGLFMLCCWLLLSISWNVRGNSYFDVLEQFLPSRVAKFYDGLLLLYLFSLTVVMFAGSGAVFQGHGRPFTLGVLLLAAAVFGGLLFNVQGLLTLNSWVTPILSGLLVMISLFFIADQVLSGSAVSPSVELRNDAGRLSGHLDVAGIQGEVRHTASNGGAIGFSGSIGISNDLQQPLSADGRWPYGVWASAIVYTAFNLLPMVGVLTTSAQTCTHPRQLLAGTWLSGMLLGLLAAAVNMALLLLPKSAGEQQEILLLDLAVALPLRIDGLVSFILWLAIFTTALSSMYGLAVRLASAVAIPYPAMVGLLVLLVIPCSYFGFASLVKILYPIYGIASLFFVGSLLMYPLRGLGRGAASTAPKKK